MKKNLLYLFCLIMVFACKKENNHQCFKVKFIDSFCYTHIYQIISPEFKHLGQSSWIRQSDSMVFENVFVLDNFCEDLSSSFDTFSKNYTVRLLAENEKKNFSCFTCQAEYNNPPFKKLAIKSFACDP